ncbi:MAG: autotransporter-associated beta strand repeat-containing protein, partial [Verrucomicrobiaceae bacterium]|nr:autotransporter-associated beta strand repeat-containing protein [Verrucomicrobiaceae bacterium]
AGGIALSGSGALELTAANSFAGPTTVSGGVLTVQNGAALGAVTNGVNVQSGGTLAVANNVAIGAEAISLNGAGASGQSGALVSSGGVNTYGGMVTAASNASIAALPGSTLHLTGGLVKNGTVATLTGGGNIVISGTGISGVSANSDLVVDGATVTLNVASSYNGPTFIQNSGALVLGIDFALPTTPRTDMSITASGVFDLASHDDALATLSGSSSGVVKNSTVSTTSALEIATTGGSSTFSGTIAGTNGGTQGDIALTKSGSGTQVLAGSNSYSGGTTITGGTLQIGGGGTTGQLGSGAVSNDANLAVNRSDSITLNQAITGTGTVSQVGAGTTILTGNNSYTGGTTIASGTLRMGNGGLTGSVGSGDISNNGQFEVKRSNNVTLGQAITGSGTLAQSGPGNTTLSGNANTYSGGTVISNGTLVASNTTPGTSATGTGTVSVQNSARLAGSGRISGDVTFSAGSKLLVGNLLSDSHGQDFEFAGNLASLGSFEARFDLFSNLGTGTLNSSLAVDQLVISGGDRLISLDLDLVLADPNSLLNWAVGDSWQIWNWGSITGGNRDLTVASLNAPSLPGGYAWDTSQLNLNGTISIILAPEPARALLLILGVAGALTRRRRGWIRV